MNTTNTMNPLPTTYRVLLVEDDEDDYIITRSLLSNKPFVLIWAQTISSALQYLRESEIDVVLLDLTIPDSQGLDTFDKLRAYASMIPIVLLTGMKDDRIAADAVERGAQDYLVKGDITAALLERSLKYSLLRKRAERDATKIERLQQREDFVAAFTHDLHNPMMDTGKILAALAKTDMSNFSREQVELLSELSETNSTVQRILRELLDIYRYEKKSDTFKMQNTDLAALVQECVNEFQSAFQQRRIDLQCCLSPPKAAVCGNPDDLHRAVAGLLRNTLSAEPPPEAVRLTLDYSADTARLQIASSSTSTSAGPDRRQSIRSGSEEKSPGGLNMYLCKQIIKSHGGSLSLTDGKSTGATETLTVMLPTTKRSAELEKVST